MIINPLFAGFVDNDDRAIASLGGTETLAKVHQSLLTRKAISPDCLERIGTAVYEQCVLGIVATLGTEPVGCHTDCYGGDWPRSQACLGPGNEARR